MQKEADVLGLDVPGALGVEDGPDLLVAAHLLSPDARDAAVLLVDEASKLLDDDTEDEVDKEVCAQVVGVSRSLTKKAARLVSEEEDAHIDRTFHVMKRA